MSMKITYKTNNRNGVYTGVGKLNVMCVRCTYFLLGRLNELKCSSSGDIGTSRMSGVQRHDENRLN